MWIRVALDKNAIQGTAESYLWISGAAEEYYFDEIVADKLEKDGFLTEMWDKLDALFDWGDSDFFPPNKCQLLKVWLEKRLEKKVDASVREVYEKLLDYANKAIELDTGISFDF